MLSSYIRKENIIMNLESSDKDVLFAEMTECLVRSNPALDRKSVLKALEKRESKKNTCIFRSPSLSRRTESVPRETRRGMDLR